jgi:hypothetical protein
MSKSYFETDIYTLQEACDSVRGEILYNILIEFGIPMQLVRQCKMCLSETYSKVHTGEHMSNTSLFRIA